MEVVMGLLENLGTMLKGVLGNTQAGEVPALISSALAKTGFGDLSGLVSKLQEGGLNDQVQSWLRTGSNLPVQPDQIRAALGSDQVKGIAEHFGLPVDGALKFLA